MKATELLINQHRRADAMLNARFERVLAAGYQKAIPKAAITTAADREPKKTPTRSKTSRKSAA
jgi:hypothetical protein